MDFTAIASEVFLTGFDVLTAFSDAAALLNVSNKHSHERNIDFGERLPMVGRTVKSNGEYGKFPNRTIIFQAALTI